MPAVRAEPDFWCGDLRWDAITEAKLRQKHNRPTPAQITEAVCYGHHIKAEWTDDRRENVLFVTAEVDEGLIRVILEPIDEHDGRWELVTAWRI